MVQSLDLCAKIMTPEGQGIENKSTHSTSLYDARDILRFEDAVPYLLLRVVLDLLLPFHLLCDRLGPPSHMP